MDKSIANDPARLMDLFGKHLVALSVAVQDQRPETRGHRNIVFPGVLMFVRDFAFFVTAGHILSDLEYGVSSGQLAIRHSFLLDIFGPSRKTDFPIAFDFASSVKYSLVDDTLGIDYGLIVLDDYYLKLLRVNKVVPILEINWAKQSNIIFDCYFLLGFPQGFKTGEETSDRQLLIAPTLIPVFNLNPIPEDLRKSRSNSFLGKLDDSLDIRIEGTSGGPIFGLRLQPAPVAYWIVAIQSAWLPDRKIIMGCPIPLIAALIERLIDRARAGGREES